MKVTVRGQTYNSVLIAAQALGVSPSAVYEANRNGTLDKLGLGCGGREPIPVKLGGFEWKSIGAAARALGCDHRWLRQVLAKGGPVAYKNLDRKVEAYKEKLKNANDN